MATTKPRITVTLTDRQYELLQAMSKFAGKPMSATITELIDAAAPTLERMAATFQRISEHQNLERQRIAKQLEEAQAVMEPLVMSTLDQFDLFLGKIEEAAAVGARDSEATRATAADATPTPATNRGVTPLHGKPLKPAPRKASRPVRSGESFQKKGG